MRLPRPQSLSGLVMLGLVLVAVPLTIAVVNGASELRRLTTASEQLVRQSVEATRQNQSLQKQAHESKPASPHAKATLKEFLLRLNGLKFSHILSSMRSG